MPDNQLEIFQDLANYSVPKWGIFRGTKDLPFKNKFGDITYMDRPDWRHQLRPHWDLNPWIHCRDLERGDWPLYQALVALVDCPEEVGGFQTVPGSAKYLPTWCAEHKPLWKNRSMQIPEDDPIRKYFQHIPLRKGEIVIFDGAQAHCNFANYSPKMRLFQFIRMLPAFKTCEDKDRFAPLRIIQQYPEKFETWKSEIKLTPLGRKLVGLDVWED